MTNKTGNKNFEEWNLEIARKINQEDSLERVYFSGQRKILQLKREMNKNSSRDNFSHILQADAVQSGPQSYK